MALYNLLEYRPAYEKTSGSLWQYCKDIPTADNNNAILNFTGNNLTDSFNFKVKRIGQTGDDGTKSVEIMVPLSYLSAFWRSPSVFKSISLSVGLKSECKLFADDTSLFAVVHDVNISKNDRNSDLQKTYEWTYQ